jgi:hypothetical protein
MHTPYVLGIRHSFIRADYMKLFSIRYSTVKIEYSSSYSRRRYGSNERCPIILKI